MQRMAGSEQNKENQGFTLLQEDNLDDRPCPAVKNFVASVLKKDLRDQDVAASFRSLVEYRDGRRSPTHTFQPIDPSKVDLGLLSPPSSPSSPTAPAEQDERLPNKLLDELCEDMGMRSGDQMNLDFVEFLMEHDDDSHSFMTHDALTSRLLHSDGSGGNVSATSSHLSTPSTGSGGGLVAGGVFNSEWGGSSQSNVVSGATTAMSSTSNSPVRKRIHLSMSEQNSPVHVQQFQACGSRKPSSPQSTMCVSRKPPSPGMPPRKQPSPQPLSRKQQSPCCVGQEFKLPLTPLTPAQCDGGVDPAPGGQDSGFNVSSSLSSFSQGRLTCFSPRQTPGGSSVVKEGVDTGVGDSGGSSKQGSQISNTSSSVPCSSIPQTPPISLDRGEEGMKRNIRTASGSHHLHQPSQKRTSVPSNSSLSHHSRSSLYHKPYRQTPAAVSDLDGAHTKWKFPASDTLSQKHSRSTGGVSVMSHKDVHGTDAVQPHTNTQDLNRHGNTSHSMPHPSSTPTYTKTSAPKTGNDFQPGSNFSGLDSRVSNSQNNSDHQAFVSSTAEHAHQAHASKPRQSDSNKRTASHTTVGNHGLTNASLDQFDFSSQSSYSAKSSASCNTVETKVSDSSSCGSLSSFNFADPSGSKKKINNENVCADSNLNNTAIYQFRGSQDGSVASRNGRSVNNEVCEDRSYGVHVPKPETSLEKLCTYPSERTEHGSGKNDGSVISSCPSSQNTNCRSYPSSTNQVNSSLASRIPAYCTATNQASELTPRANHNAPFSHQSQLSTMNHSQPSTTNHNQPNTSTTYDRQPYIFNNSYNSVNQHYTSTSNQNPPYTSTTNHNQPYTSTTHPIPSGTYQNLPVNQMRAAPQQKGGESGESLQLQNVHQSLLMTQPAGSGKSSHHQSVKAGSNGFNGTSAENSEQKLYQQQLRPGSNSVHGPVLESSEQKLYQQLKPENGKCHGHSVTGSKQPPYNQQVVPGNQRSCVQNGTEQMSYSQQLKPESQRFHGNNMPYLQQNGTEQSPFPQFHRNNVSQSSQQMPYSPQLKPENQRMHGNNVSQQIPYPHQVKPEIQRLHGNNVSERLPYPQPVKPVTERFHNGTGSEQPSYQQLPNGDGQNMTVNSTPSLQGKCVSGSSENLAPENINVFPTGMSVNRDCSVNRNTNTPQQISNGYPPPSPSPVGFRPSAVSTPVSGVQHRQRGHVQPRPLQVDWPSCEASDGTVGSYAPGQSSHGGRGSESHPSTRNGQPPQHPQPVPSPQFQPDSQFPSCSHPRPLSSPSPHFQPPSSQSCSHPQPSLSPHFQPPSSQLLSCSQSQPFQSGAPSSQFQTLGSQLSSHSHPQPSPQFQSANSQLSSYSQSQPSPSPQFQGQSAPLSSCAQPLGSHPYSSFHRVRPPSCPGQSACPPVQPQTMSLPGNAHPLGHLEHSHNLNPNLNHNHNPIPNPNRIPNVGSNFSSNQNPIPNPNLNHNPLLGHNPNRNLGHNHNPNHNANLGPIPNHNPNPNFNANLDSIHNHNHHPSSQCSCPECHEATQSSHSLGPASRAFSSKQKFIQNLILDEGNSAYRSHPLFPLLRDLVIAGMNFDNPRFHYQPLLNMLPHDFEKLLHNYLQRNPPAGDYQSNYCVESVLMDSLRLAHGSLVEKINAQREEKGKSVPPSSNQILDDFCDRFDQARMGSGMDGMNGYPMTTAPHPTSDMTPVHIVTPVGGQTKFMVTLNEGELMGPMMFQAVNESGDMFTMPGVTTPRSESKKHPNLPKEAVTLMMAWLKEHKDNPYPNDDEKATLIQETGLTINQINYWFTNARRRVLPKWNRSADKNS